LTGDALLEQVTAIMRDPGRRQAMAAASRALGRPDAAGLVYKEMRALLDGAAAT
jgi:UDP-N-acetylglucosamine:LPS N-acetylglucosamine transferase